MPKVGGYTYAPKNVLKRTYRGRMVRTVTTCFGAVKTRIILCAWILCSFAMAGTAYAQVPSFSKIFSPDTIGPGSTSTLSFTITNGAGGPLTDLSFTDTLPAGVTIATPANALTNCAGATLSAPDGGGTITLLTGYWERAVPAPHKSMSHPRLLACILMYQGI